MKQVIIGGYYDLLNVADTEYNSISGGYVSWYNVYASRAQCISTPGTLRNLRVELDDVPGTGTYVFTLHRAVGLGAWANTILTCTVAADGTTASDTEHDVTVAAGDVITLECNPDSPDNARYARWTIEFEGDNASESLILTTSWASTATTYYLALGRVGYSSTENSVRSVCPTSGTIKNLFVWLNKDPGDTGDDAYRFTLRIANAGNGYTLTSTALTCTITADDRTGNDAVNEVTVAAGDILTIMVEPLNVPADSVSPAIGMTFVADTDNESIIWGGSANPLNATDTEYNYLATQAAGVWTATEAQRYQLAQECTLKKLYMLLSGDPGGTDKYTFTVRKEGASPASGLVVEIAGGSTTGNDTTNTIAVSDGDTVNMMVVPTDTPAVADAYWGLVCYISSAAPIVTPPTLALTLTEYAPTVKTPRLVTPTTLVLSITEYAPVIKVGITITPSTLALSLTEYAPTVTFTENVLATPSTLALSLTEYAPTVKTPRLVTPPTLALSLTMYAPVVVKPACTVEIDSSEVYVVSGSLSIENRIEERSTASFTVIDLDGSEDYVDKTPVSIHDPSGILLFAGFIDTPGRARISPTTGLLHDITCVDNHYLADKRLVVKSYANKTLAYIVTDIFTDYLEAEGVTVGEIQTGPTISESIFNYVKVSDAFNALKDISGFTWLIDENKALYFIDRATNAAPWQLDNSTHRPIGKPYLSTGNSMYRNRQYVRGGTGTTAEQTETFIGDGTVQSFPLGYPCSVAPTSITDSVLGAGTIGIKGVDTGKDYYWNKGGSVIYCDTAPVADRTLTVVYYGQYPLISLAVNTTAIADRKAVEGTTGFVEEMVTETQHDTSDGIKESAQAKLDQYCRSAEKFQYQTYDSGLSPGQLQEITYSPFGFSAHEMLIESIVITSNGDRVLYDVTCITGPSFGSWAKFFANLLTRQDNAIRIGDSLLLVLLQQAETLTLSETTDINTDEFTISGEVNRSIALPPAQGALHNVEHERLTLSETVSDTEEETEGYRWG